MRELVIISINIIYLKDLLQFYERGHAKAEYLNLPTGTTDVQVDEAKRRIHSLKVRMKRMLENLMNSDKTDSSFTFNIDVEHASLTRKQLEKGYALFTNVRGYTYALNLRNGGLFHILEPERNVIDPHLASLEYTAVHEGPVYKFFEIDQTDPLKGEIRY